MEQDRDFDYRIFDSLIDKNIRFAIYRLARQKEVNLILQTSPDTQRINSLPELKGLKGFVVAPFHISNETPVVVIQPDIYKAGGEKAVFEYLKDVTFLEKGFSDKDIRVQSSLGSFEKYADTYKLFHLALTNDKLQKIVLSRTYDVEKEVDFSAGVAFRKACEIHSESFIFLCNTPPETGTWMGDFPPRASGFGKR